MKSNKGITLVALVITIIVLLILAGVSISLVVGENGVLTQATGASDTTKIAQMKEAMGLAISSCQADYFNAYANNASASWKTYINGGTLNDALSKQGYYLHSAANTVATSSIELNEDGVTFLITAIEGDTTKDRLKVVIKGTSGTSISVVSYGDNLKGEF